MHPEAIFKTAKTEQFRGLRALRADQAWNLAGSLVSIDMDDTSFQHVRDGTNETCTTLDLVVFEQHQKSLQLVEPWTYATLHQRVQQWLEQEGIRTEQSALQPVVKKWEPTKSLAVAIGKVISSRGRKSPRSLNKQKAGVAGSHLWRDAHSQSGEPTEVELYCANCQAESSRRMDGRPQYTMTKGFYVAWEHCYNNCGKRKPWSGRQQRHFILLNLAFDMSRSTHSLTA